jgi:ABC-type maltose transport system permease subunit
MLAFIDTRALAETVVASIVAGVGVTIVFSVALYGMARFAEMGREGRTAAAMFFGSVAAVAGLAFVAVIVVGIIVMTTK